MSLFCLSCTVMKGFSGVFVFHYSYSSLCVLWPSKHIHLKTAKAVWGMIDHLFIKLITRPLPPRNLALLLLTVWKRYFEGFTSMLRHLCMFWHYTYMQTCGFQWWSHIACISQRYWDKWVQCFRKLLQLDLQVQTCLPPTVCIKLLAD